MVEPFKRAQLTNNIDPRTTYVLVENPEYFQTNLPAIKPSVW